VKGYVQRNLVDSGVSDTQGRGHRITSPFVSIFGFGAGFLIFTFPTTESFFGSALATAARSTRSGSELEAMRAVG
jgi:hypothetical protein